MSRSGGGPARSRPISRRCKGPSQAGSEKNCCKGGCRILCAIYVRLSKEDEDHRQSESESIRNQKSLLAAYAAAQGWDVCAVYCDEDYSGADSLRPDFNRMLLAAERKEFQIILCKSQSRFTRDMELVEKYIHGLFPIWGIRFIAIADNADTGVRGNKKARQINGLVNEWYLEDLSENVRMVLDQKRREGRYIGGFPVYGYKKDPADKNRIVIDPEAAEVVRQIFRWSLEGCGKQEIARRLNERGILSPSRYKAQRGCGPPAPNGGALWSKTAVWRILRNEMYAGTMVQGRRKKASYKSKRLLDVPEDQWYRVEGTHAPIVSREDFDAVQRSLALRARSDGRGETHLLSGLVKCMDCGSAMSKVTGSKQGGPGAAYLRCKRYAGGGKRLCTRHSIRLDKLTELVSERVRQYVRTCYRLAPPDLRPERDAGADALERERKDLAAQLEKRSRALKTLYLDRASGILTEGQFAGLNRAFLEEADRLERRLSAVDSALSAYRLSRRQDGLTERAEELLKLETVPRELITALVERIEIGERDPGTGEQRVRITWKF